MSSRNINNDVLPKLIAALDKIYATTQGTDDTIGTLRDSIHELKRTAMDMESTNTLIHDSLSRLERSINRIDSRLRRIEEEMQKKQQGQQEAERVSKRVQESEDRKEREKKQRLAPEVIMTSISEMPRRTFEGEKKMIASENHANQNPRSIPPKITLQDLISGPIKKF
ncbi:hypothetical protein FMEXI_11381 [Fusarium mexicanum]|uniref:Uncharacterized protein n=1 Tax=Fusarium mexicanum TaxID=751941 RepID=A0A8H5ICE9_9HYPO|nr:hypothetical protein FMEXI_11381 [Fusarium mexicanum]